MCPKEDFKLFELDLNYYNLTERVLDRKYPLDASAKADSKDEHLA